MFDDPKSLIPCFKCRAGHMQKLLEYSTRHVLMQCTNCHKIDEIAITGTKDKAVLGSIVQEWDEPVEKAFDELSKGVRTSFAELTEWKQQNPEKTSELHAAISGWNEFENLYYLMVETDDKKSVTVKGTPWQYILLEADRELKASLNLAIQGHTKVAYKSLRSFLELSLFGISLMGSPEEKFNRWFNGGPTPSFNGSNGILDSISGAEPFNHPELSEWEGEVKQLYKTLSGYVHTQGKEFSSLWLWNNAHLRFDQEVWENWVNLAIDTIRKVCLVLVTIFPTSMLPFDVLRVEAFDAPTGLFVDFKQHQTIADLFDPQSLGHAKLATNRNAQAIDFIKTVSNSRRLTEKDIDESMNRFLKVLEKSGRYTDELSSIKHSSSFQGTVRWTVLFGLQKKVERDIGLEAIAKRLELVH